jgi:cell division control protein 45
VFVACLSVDALCASKILTGVLKKELVQYQIVPIVGYTDLKNHYEKLDGDITNIILLGCGAMVDLESFFDIDPNDFIDKEDQNLDGTFNTSRSIYIVDGHKPWNLDNIFGSHIVKCLDDGSIDRELEKEREAYTTLIRLQDQEDGDQEEGLDTDEDDDYDDDDEEEDEEEIIDGLEEDDEEEVSSSQAKKRKAKQESKTRKRQMKEHELIVEQYYSTGTTITVSVSLQIYTLLSEIGETNTENLWLAIIGTISLDSQYPEVYRSTFDALKAEVTRLSPTASGSSKNADSSQLSVDTDYYLFLLRHWTLYDSFYYSNYVNAKLKIWSEDGRKKLHKMFARMGISLQDSKQNWLYMDSTIKKNLNVTFNKVLGFYGLDDLIREGFVRTYGFRGSLSASECVESILALLEHDKVVLERKEDEDLNELIARKEKTWIQNFWSSWDALGNNIDLINRGLEYAKDFQKVVFNTGMAVLEKRMLKTLKIYHLVVLKDGPDDGMFRNPLILTRLGNWILESCAEASKTLLPLVLAAFDERTDTYLVIGLAPRYPRGRKPLEDVDQNTTLLNTFSVAFQQVANTSGAKVRIDSFESSIIEIRKEDLAPFLEKLTLSGLV